LLIAGYHAFRTCEHGLVLGGSPLSNREQDIRMEILNTLFTTPASSASSAKPAEKLRIGDDGMPEEQYWDVYPPRNR
jgi:hypothetical protein